MKRALIAAVLAALLLASCGAERQAGSSDADAASPGAETEDSKTGEAMNSFFSEYPNVKISGIDVSSLSDAELALLRTQAAYCQAMTDADVGALRALVAEDTVFVHMSGRRQTREEYFADIADGSLRYYAIGIADPVIRIDGSKGSITFTSVLNASAYGARGTYRMKGTHYYELRGGSWIAVNK